MTRAITPVFGLPSSSLLLFINKLVKCSTINITAQTEKRSEIKIMRRNIYHTIHHICIIFRRKMPFVSPPSPPPPTSPPLFILFFFITRACRVISAFCCRFVFSRLIFLFWKTVVSRATHTVLVNCAVSAYAALIVDCYNSFLMLEQQLSQPNQKRNPYSVETNSKKTLK